MYTAARKYVNFGWPILPIEEGGKVPVTRHGVKNASTSYEDVERWWGENPNYNIGIATGEPSGVVVVDVDGKEGLESLEALVSEHPLVPMTATVRTPRGVHLYFQRPEEGLRNSASKLAPGIDVRGDGGYVLAPPSVVDGKEYFWMRQSRPVPFPEALLERLTNDSGPFD